MIKRSSFTIGIAGGTGSGKTILASDLAKRLGSKGACLLGLDSYYVDRSDLSEVERTQVNYDQPNAIDHQLLLAHLKTLLRGECVEKPVYCFDTHTRRVYTQRLSPAPLILVEGLFAFWDPEVRELLDLKIFVDADSDLRVIRRMRRDALDRGRSPESVMEQYLTSVRPMHQLYIEPCKKHSDLVLNNNGADPQIFLAKATRVIARFLEDRGVPLKSHAVFGCA